MKRIDIILAAFDTNYLIAISCPYYGTHAMSLQRPKTLISVTQENVSLQLFQSASGFILQKGRISFLYIDKCNIMKIVYSPCVT